MENNPISVTGADEIPGVGKKAVSTKTAAQLKEMLGKIDAESAGNAARLGGLSARGRLEALFDAGTFIELAALAGRAEGGVTAEDFAAGYTAGYTAGYATGHAGVICGYGAVGGRLTFAFSQDCARNAGVLDAPHANKIVRLYELARSNGSPVVGIFDSAGVFVLEGAAAMASCARIIREAAGASGIIPQIAYIPGLCAGALAAAAALFDFTVTLAGKTKFYVNSPFLLNKTDSDYVCPEGLSAVRAETEEAAIAQIKSMLGFLPQNNYAGTPELTADPIPGGGMPDGYNDGIIREIADGGAFLELYADYAPELAAGFIFANGMACGVCANRREIRGGAITPQAARKAARFVTFCDGFAVPLLFLVDSDGAELSADAEASPLAAELARLAAAIASSVNAKINIITGSAIGAAMYLTGSRSLGADIVYALDGARVGVLPAASAVAFLWGDRLDGAADPAAVRAELEAEWNASAGSAAEAARLGEIDGIIGRDELRIRVCSALEMLAAKCPAPQSRKRAVPPL